jgi:thymidylate synthase (FAD)
MEVVLIDHMGDDNSVCDAARVSFAKLADKYSPEQNAKLIRYLAKHNHWTPFGHAFASFRIKAPIFVARQLGKHQVGLVWNEVSRRYVDDEPEFYVPDAWRKRAENVKQGSSDDRVWHYQTLYNNDRVTTLPEVEYQEITELALKVYNEMLAGGVCPEQARIVLPQSMMTEWVWSGSLAAFARVCKLRLDPHTQYETRLVAEQISAAMSSLYPVSWEALSNG